jgi:NAD(P)-dependent dehydrogenase (short-subunit alcohol dehydrogenase family)
MGRMDGKIVLITGGAQGLGEATARMLVREGAKVAVTDINVEGANAVAKSLGDSAIAIEHDVTDESQWQLALKSTVDHFGGLNVLVNNAGIMEIGSVEDISFDDWKRTHSIDLDSVFLGCKYAIQHIAASGGGAIVNISSISGIIGGYNTAAYNSAKAGVRLLTKSVALHCARKQNNIRCNSIHPVFIDTPLIDSVMGDRNAPGEARSKLAKFVPLGKIGEPDDVAYAVVYLASDESKLMTGSELIIDGGLSAM